MKYVFVLGKNQKLSIAEILTYFKARNINFKIKDILDEVVVFQLDDEINSKTVMLDLGGTIKICELIYEFNVDDVLDKKTEFNIQKLFPEINGNKVRFGVSVYANKKNAKKLWDVITIRIKELLKESHIRMIHVTPSKRVGLPVLKHFEVMKKLLNREGYELVVCVSDKILYISRTATVHNPYEFRKRDVERPEQRTIYSIPPRLAKILINLSSAKPGDILLDPFCGIGTILQEALLMGMDIRGVDIEAACIKKSLTNLEWIKREYNLNTDLQGKLIAGDSRRLSNYFEQNSIDAVATEPYLGPPLRKKPTKVEAKKILKDIRPFYLECLKEINTILKPGKSVSMIFPNFETQEGIELGLDIENLAKETNFIIKNPFQGYPTLEGYRNLKTIIDADTRHRTRREICILEKKLE